MDISWTELKSFVTANGLSVQYSIAGANYNLWAGDRQCSVPLDRDLSLDTVDFEDNFKANANKLIIDQQQPFAAKTVGIKKLYKRVHGVSVSATEGSNTILYTIPYPWVKITGLEIVGGESLDNVSLYILDTTTGTYSTVPNYELNQFGFTVQVSKDYYSHYSEFDADLYQNMQIKLVYESNSAKSIGFNFILNEVKD